MEPKVVQKKPRLRTPKVRSCLNRCLLAATAAACDKNTIPTRRAFHRLAAISSAQLEAIRSSARGIEFVKRSADWALKLDFGQRATTVEFRVPQSVMSVIVRLLRVPIRLDLSRTEDVDWEELEQVGEFVNALKLGEEPASPAFSQFVNGVVSFVADLTCSSAILERLPSLKLEKLTICSLPVGYKALARHTIGRLDVPMTEIADQFEWGHALSTSIKSLGLVKGPARLFLSPCEFRWFCQRFPALEDLHIVVECSMFTFDPAAHYKKLWADCLLLRDRVNSGDVALKRLFFTVKQTIRVWCSAHNKNWTEKLQKVAPFNEATFVVDPAGGQKRMFLKHGWPKSALPTFFHFEGVFTRA